MLHQKKTKTYQFASYHVCHSPVDCGFDITHFGEQISNRRFRFHNLLTYHSIHMIMQGTGEFVVDGNTYATKPGDVIVFFPGQRVDYRSTSPRWRYFWIGLGGRHATELLGALGYTPGMPTYGNAMIDEKELLFLRLKRDEYRGNLPAFHAFRVAADVLALLAIPSQAQEIDIANMIKRHIDNIEVLNLRVCELADRFGVNRATIFRVFKKRHGVSVKEYIERSRMARAEEFLRESQLSITQIAAICGYTEKRHFHQAFAAAHQTTPLQFRRQARGESASAPSVI